VFQVGPVFHVGGSALSELWAEFSRRQLPLERSRKKSTPPLPSKATQYLVPDVTAVDAIVTVFQSARVGDVLVPDASSLPG